MTLRTLAGFLVGRRDAIVQVASSRAALWVAGLFVLSAGFAREYDQEDLLADPWYVLIPLAASLVTSYLLFVLVYAVSGRRSAEPMPRRGAYRSFLTTYWMTAPLAWLYAIPVERLSSEADATAANISLLALVALWRVALITRVVQVLFGASIGAALGLVMFFADSLAIAVLYFTPLPIFNIMGGIRLSASERLIQETAMFVGCFGWLSWPVWLASVGIIAGRSDRSWKPALPAEPPQAAEARLSWRLRGLVVASLAVWAFVLPFTQPEQQLRRQTERLFAEEKLSEALALMSEHEPEDYPPNWSPPPHLGYRDPKPPLVDVLELTLAEPVAPWVSERFVGKLEAKMDNHWLFYQEDISELSGVLSILQRLPNRKEVLARHPDFLSRFERLGDEDLWKRAQALQLSMDATGSDGESTSDQ